jgi:type I restriction enzyme S subunit
VIKPGEKFYFKDGNLTWFRHFRDLDSRFLYYWLLSPLGKAELKKCTIGSSQSAFTIVLLKGMEINLPPLPTQRKIAGILSAYDDLIENNTRRVKILEEMARTLYREWFVEFRIPNVELRMATPEEKKVTGKDVFPVAWNVGRLDDALLLQRGFDLPNKQRRDGNFPIYAATGIVGTHDEAKVKGPGVVTGRSGSLGTVIYVEEDYWPLNTSLWVKEFRRVTPLYAYYLLSDLELGQFNSGAAVPTLNRNDIHGLPIVIPGHEVLDKFDNCVLPLYALRRNLQERNTVLRRTHDLLLPRLVSGELEV